MSTIDQIRRRRGQTSQPCRARPPEALPRFENADRAQATDRRARAGRGRRDHDVSGLADHRRGHAGASRGRATGSRRSRARSRSRCGRAAGRDIEADVARGRRHRRGGFPASPTCGLLQGGIGAAARAMAGQRACARRPAGAAPHRRARLRRRRARSRATCARRSPSRCRLRASTIIAASSTACAPWRGAAVARRHRACSRWCSSPPCSR